MANSGQDLLEDHTLPPDDTINVRICGLLGTVKNLRPPDSAMTERQCEKFILQQMNVLDTEFTAQWHFSNERCSVRRPLHDTLGRFPDGKRYRGRGIELHPYRLASPPGSKWARVEHAEVVQVVLPSGTQHAQGGRPTALAGNGAAAPAGRRKESTAQHTAPADRSDPAGNNNALVSQPNGSTAPGRPTAEAGPENPDTGEDDRSALSSVDEALLEAGVGGVTPSGAGPLDRTDFPEIGDVNENERASHNQAVDEEQERHADAGEDEVELLTLDLRCGLHDLRTSIRAAVVKLIQSAPNARNRLGAATSIRTQTTVSVNNGSTHPVDIDDASYGSRLSTVSDLFGGTIIAAGLLDAIVTIQVERSNVRAKRVKMSTTRLSAKEAKELVQAVEVPRSFYRVGDMQQPQVPDNDKPVPQEWPILAETDEQAKKVVNVWGTEAWSLHGRCIGGFECAKENLAVSNTSGYIWYYGLENPISRSDLARRIFGIKQRAVPTDPGLPFWPEITFIPFDIHEYTPLGSVAIGDVPSGVGVVVRFHSHVRLIPSSALPDNLQFTFNDNADHRSVMAHILHDLPTTGGAALFEEDAREHWAMELWVMPQQPGRRRLYRFQEADDVGTPNLLISFMSQESVGRGQRRLYMEAHIWPKRNRLEK